MQTIDIVTYGDLIADILLPVPVLPISPDQEQLARGIFIEPGGMGNFLIMASRLGASVAPLGRLADDPYGQMILEKLNQEGIHTHAVEVLAGKQTTLAFVFVSDAGEHVFLGVLGSTKMDAEANLVACTTLPQCRAFYTNGYAFLDADPPRLVIAAMQEAKRSGVPVYFDPGPQIQHLPREWMVEAVAEADTLLLTNDEAACWTGKVDPETAAEEILDQGPRMAVLKLGAEGCLISTRKETLAIKAFPAKVYDTSGAGDAFDAAFIVGVQRGLSFSQAGSLANAVGAAAVTKLGAGTRLPKPKEVAVLLEEHASVVPGFLLEEGISRS